MTKRRCKNTAFAKRFRPGYGKVLIGTADVLVVEIDFVLIEAHKHSNFVTRPVFVLVDLVVDHDLFGQVPGHTGLPILNEDRRLEGVPRMGVEPAPDEFSVFRPFVQCVSGGVHGNKPFAVVAYERQ
jgi:hypothetical protein